MKRNSDLYKKLAIFACLAAAIYIIFIIIKPINNKIEGLATVGDAKPESVADEDPDLKCPASSSGADPTKCTTADLMKLAYDIAADPRLSVMELNTISEVCNSRKFEEGYNVFAMTAMTLRAATMYNTTANEKYFKGMLDDMTKSKEKQKCFDNDFMKSVKGLLVGSKDERTLSVAQSEAVRCYAHRINAFKKCLNACK